MARSGKVRAVLAGAGILVGLASHAAAQDTTVSAGISLRAVTGTFGSAESTTLVYAPATLQVTIGRLELSGNLPWLSINNGSIVPSQGGFIPMRGSMAGAPGAGIPMGGMMGGRPGGSGSAGIPSVVPGTGARQSGAGDIVVGAGYRVVDQSARGLQVVAAARIKIPTASAETGLGTGKRDVALLGTLRKQFASGWVYAEGGYVVIGDLPDVDLRNAALWAVGAGRRVQPRLYLLVSASGSTSVVPEFGAPIEIGAGIGVPLGRGLNLTVVPSVGLNAASPNAALTIGFSTDLIRR